MSPIQASFGGTPLTDLLEPLGWAVLHSLWQGALCLAVVLVIRRLAGPNRPQVSYLAGLAGLLATFAAFLATFVWFAKAGASGGAVMADLIGSTLPGGTDSLVASGGATPDAAANLDAAAPLDPSVPAAAATGTLAGLDWARTVPWLGLIWTLGFFVLSLQCMYAWAKTRCYATLGLSEPEAEWTARFGALIERAGLKSGITLKVSALVDSPVTLGTFRPLVLVPAGFLSGFPPSQVEAILLHELAHIRRHDFLIGLLQTAIRVTLYFNPAVIILSRLVDEDREQACDDFAVHTSGNPVDLAKGLASLRLSLAPPQLAAPQLAMAAAGKGARSGPLMVRLQRIMGRPVAARGLDRVTALGLSVAIIAVTALTTLSWPSDSFASESEADDALLLAEADHPHPVPPATPEKAEPFAMPETIVRPDSVPVADPMPQDFPLPDVPDLPPIPAFDSFDGFEASMEAWGDSMGDWGEDFGERFGEAFETKMEAWAERLEDRVAHMEAEGDRLEDLHDMEASELAALGLTHDDVEVATEALGLRIAESVMLSLIPGSTAAAAEAKAELHAEREALDPAALKRVERALTELKYKEKADLKARYDYSDLAAHEARKQAQRDALQAQRAIEQAKRDAKQVERDARLAQRNAEREAERIRRDAEREAERAHRDAERKARKAHEKAMHEKKAHSMDKGFDASRMSKVLLTAFREDGLIERKAESYKMKISAEQLTLDGKRMNADIHKRYWQMMLDEGLCGDDVMLIKRSPSKIYLEVGDGKNKTRITINE